MLYAALGNRPREVGCLCVMAEARINEGQPQEGIDAARAALAISVEIEDPWGQINAAAQMVPDLRASAVLAQWDNELDQAIAHLEAARDLAEQLGLPGELWQILAALGELYQACKNESQARQAFARAAQIVQSLAGRMEDEQHRTHLSLSAASPNSVSTCRNRAR